MGTNGTESLVILWFPSWYQILTRINWRRERDSNPRRQFCYLTRLAGERLQPLGHLSAQALNFCNFFPGPGQTPRPAWAVSVRWPDTLAEGGSAYIVFLHIPQCFLIQHNLLI